MDTKKTWIIGIHMTEGKLASLTLEDETFERVHLIVANILVHGLKDDQSDKDVIHYYPPHRINTVTVEEVRPAPVKEDKVDESKPTAKSASKRPNKRAGKKQ